MKTKKITETWGEDLLEEFIKGVVENTYPRCSNVSVTIDKDPIKGIQVHLSLDVPYSEDQPHE